MGDERAKRHHDGFAPLKVAGELSRLYDSVTFTVTDGATDYDVRTQVSDAFKNVDRASFFWMSFNQAISVRFNSTSNSSLSLTLNNSPLELRDLLSIENIFITNASGSDASVTLFLI